MRASDHAQRSRETESDSGGVSVAATAQPRHWPAGNAPSLPRTPKLTQAEKRGLIYPYYAGFSEAFVTSILSRLCVTERWRVLDPWNGSGTTTYVASTLGITSTGYDINPALTVVAAARASTPADLAAAQVAWDRLYSEPDALDAPAVEQCARLYHQIVASDSDARLHESPRAKALILCALFDTLRRNYDYAKTRNPAWFSSKRDEAPLVSFAEIAKEASQSFCSLILRQSRSASFVRRTPNLSTCDFLKLAPATASFDAVITSPPYLTRLDYVKATLPELALISRLQRVDVRQLRMQMMGSPLVGSTAPPIDPRWGPTALQLLEQVRLHPSKASNTYYLRFFLKYFASLNNALHSLYRLIAPRGACCIVVQTSHYKEQFIDLPIIVAEMGINVGFEFEERIDFSGRRSIVTINSRANATAMKSLVESTIVFVRP